MLFCVSQYTCEALLVKGLQQVSQGVYFESSQRVLIVGSDKDDFGHLALLGKRFDNFESVHAWHLDIKKDEVRIRLCYLEYRFFALACLSCDLDIRVRFKKTNDLPAGRSLIIDHESAQAHDAAALAV